MAALKTKETDQSIVDFIEQIDHDRKKKEAYTLLEIIKEVSGEEAKMWGPSIIGFGKYRYVYESGREGEWMLTGFSPRKAKHSLYIMSGFGRFDELMSQLGKHKTGKSCLYVNKLDDIDLEVLKELIAASIEAVKDRYKEFN
jgi:hypothetical protein